jgi:hypothetical protein
MVIVSTREFRDSQKKYFDLAEDEQVSVRRGKKFVNLLVTDKPETKFVNDTWLNDFFSIPVEYRCNPFEISSSGDLFFADKRNIEHLNKSLEQAQKGKVNILSKDAQKKLFNL